MQQLNPLTVSPGQVIGLRPARRHERPGLYPIFAIAGGSAPLPGTDPTPPAPTPAPPVDPAPSPAPTPPAPADPAPEPGNRLEDLLAGLEDKARDAVLAAVKKARDEAARYRTERTTAAQQAQAAQAQRDAVLKALGLKTDGTPDIDPAQAAEEAANRAWVAEVSLAIHTAAGRLGADASKLLDSMTFLDSLDQHVTVQPSDPQFASQVDAAITAAITANPAYKAQAAVPPASGAPLPPSPGEGNQRPKSIADALRKRYGTPTA